MDRVATGPSVASVEMSAPDARLMRGLGWRGPRGRAAAGWGVLLVLLLPVLAGCTGLTSPPRPDADLSVEPQQIEVGDAVDFDARDSATPDGSVITTFLWDFGDGQVIETKQGFTSHVYLNSGTYRGKMTVINDQGGEDSLSFEVFVNGPPIIILDHPQAVKVGQVVVVDASGSFDPEAGILEYAWDTNLTRDTDSDGNPANDVDSTDPRLELQPNRSGQVRAALVVTDDKGSTDRAEFTIDVVPRWWQVEWVQRDIIFEWDGFLGQGETWTKTHEPLTDLVVQRVNASLELATDQPLQWPQDNFTLVVRVPSAGWAESDETEAGAQPTDAARAWIEREGLNDRPSDATYEADSQTTLLQLLLGTPGLRFGHGEWEWQIRADEADPDGLVPELDPDPGNDWDLRVTYTVLEPIITEVGSPDDE